MEICTFVQCALRSSTRAQFVSLLCCFCTGRQCSIVFFCSLKKMFHNTVKSQRKSPKNLNIWGPNTFLITLNSNTFYNRNLDNYWYLRKFESKPLTHNSNNNNSIGTVFCFVFLINNHKFFFCFFHEQSQSQLRILQ